MAEEEEKQRSRVDANTVFIRGLPFSFNDSQLEQAFEDVGPVRRAFTVKEKATETHRGVAFVQFALADDAQRAVELKNQTLLDGRKIKVEIAKRRAPLHERRKKQQSQKEEQEEKNIKKPAERGETQTEKQLAAGRNKSNKRERAPGDEGTKTKQGNKTQKFSQNQSAGSAKQIPARTIVIGNMAKVDPVVSLAEKLGDVESINKSLSQEYLYTQGLSRDGCKPPAIAVVFTSVRAAREAVATFHNQNFGDGVLWARQLGGEGAKLKKWRLIIRNLSFEVTEELLRKEFSKAGFLWEITIPRKPDGQSKGFAFAGYTSKSEAEKAIKELNGKKLERRTITVDWAVAKKEYEDIKTAENEKNQYASDETASEAESEDNDSDEEKPELGDGDELGVVKKVLEKVVKGPSEEEDEKDEEDEEEEELDDEEEVQDEDEEAMEENPKSSNLEADKTEVMQRTVFMRNLPLESNVNDLRKRFSEFGDIKAFRLVYNPGTRKPKGTAFVEFATREAAEAVVEAAEGGEGNSKLLTGGRPTIVHFAVDRSAAQKISTMKSIEERDRDKRNLYLLKEGLIEAGTKAAEGVSKSDLKKRELLQKEKATKLRSPNFHVSTTRLAIHNFPKTMDEKEVKQLFIKAVLSRASKQQPVVKQVKLLTDEKENSRGSGFVEFTEHQHALVALRVLNNNPETFGSEKRPIVEFAIDNMAKLKKRQTRIATYKNKDRSNGATLMKGSEAQKQKEDKSGTSEKQPGSEKKARSQKRKRGSEEAKPRKRGAPEEEPERETKKHGKSSKQERRKDSTTAEDEPKRKRRSRASGGEVEDELDKLVNEYRAKYFGGESQSKSLKGSIKRWFE